MTYTEFINQNHREVKEQFEKTTTHHWNSTIERIRESLPWEDMQDVDDELLIKVYNLGAIHGARTIAQRLR